MEAPSHKQCDIAVCRLHVKRTGKRQLIFLQGLNGLTTMGLPFVVNSDRSFMGKGYQKQAYYEQFDHRRRDDRSVAMGSGLFIAVRTRGPGSYIIL